MVDGNAISLYIRAGKRVTRNAARQSWKKTTERRQGRQGTQRRGLKNR